MSVHYPILGQETFCQREAKQPADVAGSPPPPLSNWVARTPAAFLLGENLQELRQTQKAAAGASPWNRLQRCPEAMKLGGPEQVRGGH